MARLYTVFVWICLCCGFSNARHTSRGTSIGRVGTPVISFDPLSLLTSGPMAGSSASSSASSGRSSASSSAGTSRSLSSSSVNVVPLRQVASRQKRPRFTRREGRPLIIISPGMTNTRHHQMAARPSTRIQTLPKQQQQAVFQINSPHVGSSILDLLGLSPSTVNAQRGASLSAQPPGVAFLGNQGISGVLSHYPLVQRSPPQIITQPVNPVPLTMASPAKTAVAAQPLHGVISKIGTTGLEVVSGTRKGEIIIRGVGGSIIIGPELLNGISTARTGLPFFSEFEEVELEGAAAAAGKRTGKIHLTDPGKGSIVIERNPSKTGTVGGRGGASSGEVFSSSAAASSASSSAGGASSSASSATGGASASASASSSAGGASSSASSSASSGGLGGANNSPTVLLGNGISVEKSNNGQVITLGQSGLRTQVITMGGQQGQVSVADGGTGIQAPGNATFIVGG